MKPPPALAELPVPFDHWGDSLPHGFGNLLKIRPELIKGLQVYAWYRRAPGDFLRAVLSDRLMEAVSRADPSSRILFIPIVEFVRDCLPDACHGSPEKVETWLRADPETGGPR